MWHTEMLEALFLAGLDLTQRGHRLFHALPAHPAQFVPLLQQLLEPRLRRRAAADSQVLDAGLQVPVPLEQLVQRAQLQTRLVSRRLEVPDRRRCARSSSFVTRKKSKPR
jgi:hypothetical protein